MKFKFDCVFYYVSDLEAAVGFYRDVLGFKLMSRDMVARFDVEGVLFEIVPGRPGGEGNGRFCLKVDEIAAACAELQKKGVHVSEIEDKGQGKLALFSDPDGNELALWEYAKARP
jgi:catechol 2,3-dioxygenase-like lactoylglutathione lyase family enzyme